MPLVVTLFDAVGTYCVDWEVRTTQKSKWFTGHLGRATTFPPIFKFQHKVPWSTVNNGVVTPASYGE